MRIFIALIFFSTLVAALAQCGGPEKFSSHISAGAGGHAGTAAAAGTAGTSAAAGTGAAGTGAAGTAAAGTGAAGTGAAGTAAAGTGAAGTGAAGTGAAGTGAAGTGAAGTGMGGRGGSGGQAGSAAGTGGGVDAGTDAPSCNCKLKVQYECRQNGAMVLQPEYSIKIANTGTTPIPLNTVTARYWYTTNNTGAQSGVCASAAHPCTIAFQPASPARPMADQYAVISFGGGTLAPGADTGEIAIQMKGTTAMTQTDDYSFYNTGANFLDRQEITGYVSGKLIWGTPP